MTKQISVAKAVSLIKDNITLGVGGFGGASAPDALLCGMAESFSRCGSPRGLTVVSGISPGDLKEDGYGLSEIKQEGIISAIYAPHVGMSPAIGRAVGANKIAGYTVPLGVYDHLLRAIAGKKPGVVTRIGLYTFCDPREDGCCTNELAKNSGWQVVSLIELDGAEYLHYKPFRLDACIIRGTLADEAGNTTLDHEVVCSEQAVMAAAVHNCGGFVIVQVEDVVENGSLDPRRVQIPGCIVDYIVKAEPQLHLQCYDGSEFRPELIGESRAHLEKLTPMPLTLRKICGRRAAMELPDGGLVNLGIGMPDSVASVVNEEGLTDRLTLSIETGVWGGVPIQGVSFGAAVNPQIIMPICDNFDLYDGGCLDAAVLGLAEADSEGNLNVSKFGGRCYGPGGFTNITQTTKKLCFIGTFTAGKPDYEIKDGRLNIGRDEGRVKFKKHVEQITFSGRYAREFGQDVLYITERAVFRLTDEGMTLTEIAPGVDLRSQILDKMEFEPHISKNLKEMDGRIFRREVMKLSLRSRIAVKK